MRIPFRMTEEILHSLDRPDEPSTIQFELRVAGSLSERELRAALDEAVARHPMTRARKVASRFLVRPAQWEIGAPMPADVLRSIDCDNDPDLAAARSEFYSQPIELGRSPALRLLLVRRPGGDSLLLSANHAVTDGVGALRFMHSVARAYSGRPDPVPAIDPLGARDLEAQFGHAISNRPQAAQRAKPRVAPPSLLVQTGAQGAPGYGFLAATLPADERWQRNARRLAPKATINDLLLASLHDAVAAWNADHERPCHTISILMPVNLRPAAWRDEIIGNLSLAAGVLTTPEQRASPESLLAAVTAQTRRIKAGDDFAIFLKRPRWVRELLLSLLLARGTRATDTAVLSNLGRIDAVPNFARSGDVARSASEPGGAVTELWFSPPVAMPTGLAVGAAGLNGRLHLVMRYRHCLFDNHAAHCYFAMFLNNLISLTTTEAHEASADPEVIFNPVKAGDPFGIE
jgi:NRPS condensation-like uncharacterized protein